MLFLKSEIVNHHSKFIIHPVVFILLLKRIAVTLWF